MLIVYDSLTGNVERFAKKLEEFNKIKIHKDLIINDPYILITYTTGIGSVPKTTADFLLNNHQFLKGVAVSGNRNWGNSFTKAADIISQEYKVPILLRFELSGTQSDLNKFIQEVNILVTNSKMDSTQQ